MICELEVNRCFLFLRAPLIGEMYIGKDGGLGWSPWKGFAICWDTPREIREAEEKYRMGFPELTEEEIQRGEEWYRRRARLELDE